MSKILVVYGTAGGHTARVADRIAEVIRDRGHDVTVLDVRYADDMTLAAYDAVVVGASIHMGKHVRRMVDFVREHREALTRMPAAFFSVSLAAVDDGADLRDREHVLGLQRRPDRLRRAHPGGGVRDRVPVLDGATSRTWRSSRRHACTVSGARPSSTRPATQARTMLGVSWSTGVTASGASRFPIEASAASRAPPSAAASTMATC